MENLQVNLDERIVSAFTLPFLFSGMLNFLRRDKPPKLKIHFDENGTVEVESYLEGLSLYMWSDFEVNTGQENYTVQIDVAPEFAGSKRSYQTEGTAIYNSKGVLTSFESNRFFGSDNLEALDAAADNISAKSAFLLNEAVKLGVPMSGLTNNPNDVDEFWKSFVEGLRKYETATEEPNILYQRRKQTGQWDVILLPTDPYVSSRGAIRHTHSVGMVSPNQGSVSLFWPPHRSDQKMIYGLETRKYEGVEIMVFKTLQPQNLFIPGKGFMSTNLVREMHLPAQIDPKRMDRLVNQRKRDTKIREWFPMFLVKP